MGLRPRIRTLFLLALAIRLGAVALSYAAPRVVALRAYRAAGPACASLGEYLARRPQCAAPLAEDEIAYDALGRNIAAGRGFVTDQGWLYTRPGEPTAYGGFLYPLFVGAVYALSGNSAFAVVLLQALLGALAVVGVAGVTRRLAGDAAGTLAGLLAAVHPGLALGSALMLTEALEVPLLVGVYACWLWLWERPGRWRAAAVGVLSAGACLTRSPALYALPVMVAAGLTGPAAAPLRRRGVPLVLAAVFLLCLAPWTARNALRFGAFVPTDTKAGGNLWLFNHPARHPFAEVWHEAPDPQPPPGPLPGLNEAEADAHFRALALAYVRERPLTVAAASGLRLGLFLVPVPRYTGAAALKWLTALFYVVVTWLGVAGLWRLRRDPRAHALAGLLVGWVLLLSLTAMSVRHRLSIEWVLVVGAGVALSAWLRPRAKRPA